MSCSSACWEPLEGTPTTLNTLAKHLGLLLDDKTTKKKKKISWKFVDVLGLDDDIVKLTIPFPTYATCTALILLYPTDDEEITKYFESAIEKSDHQEEIQRRSSKNSRCIFLKQTIGGTCGTLATVHAIANSQNCCHDAVTPGSPLHELIRKHEMSPTQAYQDRCDWFLQLDSVRNAHERAVEHMNQGKDSSVPSMMMSGQRQGRHFVTWVHKDGQLWELDGRRTEPTWRGTTSEDNFLSDAICIVREVFAASQDESFYSKCSLLALISTS